MDKIITFKNEEDLKWMNKSVMYFINMKGSKSPSGCMILKKDDVLRLLPWVDHKVIEGKAYISNHFSISRVNSVFYKLWADVRDIIELEDLFNMFFLKIIEKWEDKEYIEINTTLNHKIKDDLKILGGIRRELKHQVITEYGKVYNRRKDRESIYETIVDRSLCIDELDEIGEISEEFNYNEDEKEKQKEGLLKFYEIINNSGLTEREREFVIALEENGYNQREAAHSIGLAKSGSNNYMRRVRKKIQHHYNKHGEKIR